MSEPNMAEYSESLEDFRMAAGEIIFRLSDLDDAIPNLKLRKKLSKLAAKAYDISQELGDFRSALGRTNRPENFRS